ncbi:MAG TPA: hypothetical protein VES59_06840 [Bacteroidota bacterium]|nr:hypothetical protein [Bacteroidota bacterium]
MNPHFQVAACLILVVLALSCTKPSEPPNNLGREFRLTIVPASSVPHQLDGTYYQHDPTGRNYFDTNVADSLARFFERSALAVSDIWSPNDGFECGMTIIGGSELLLKLERPDTSIYRLGFRAATGFPLACVPTWRHYKFVSVNPGISRWVRGNNR